MLPIRKILHPTDYSDLSRQAFDLACSLARDLYAELVVCHVAPPSIMALDGRTVVALPTGEDELMTKKLQDVIPEDPDVMVTHKLLRGDEVEEIVRFAAEAKADLIVLGTHGRSGVDRLLMGSVAEGVMRKALCPVVTVRTPISAAPLAAPRNEVMEEPVAFCPG